MPKLVYTDPESDQEVSVELNEQLTEITIGRNPGNHVRVNNPSISRQHARVIYENGQCTLVDLDSSNGSYINGNRIRSQVLVDGDRIRVGEFPVQYSSRIDEATHEVDQSIIDELQREMQAPPNGGDVRRQTAMGGFGADQQSFDDRWESGSYDSVNEAADDAFNFVEGEGEDDLPDPSPAAEAAPPPLPGGGFPAAESSPGIGIDDDAILEELPANEPNPDADTYNASPNEVAAGLRALAESGENEAVSAAVEVMSGPSPIEGVPAAVGYDPQLEAQLQEVIAERDELAKALETAAGDAAGASQVQIERLRAERDRLIEERRNLKRQMSDLERAANEAPSAEELDKSLGELVEANDKITGLEMQIEELGGELAQSQNTIESLESEREMLRAQLSDAESAAAQGADLGSRLSDAEELVATRSEELQAAIDRVATLEAELQAAREEAARFVSDVEGRDERLVQLEAELADATVAVAERDTYIESINAEVDGSRSVIAELHAEVERLEAEVAARPLPDEVSEMTRDLGVAQKEIEKLSSERDSLASALARLEGELDESQKLYESLESRHSEIGGDYDKIRSERDALKREKGAFARETDYLQVEKRKLDSEVRSLRKEIKELQKQDKRKKKVFDELSSDLKKLVSENTELQSMIEDLDKQVKGAPSADDLAAMKARVDELEKEKLKAEKDLAEAERDAGTMTREIGSITDERDRLSKENERLSKELDEATRTLEAMREAAGDGEDAAATVVQLEVQVENLTHELEQAKEAAQQAQEAAAQAKNTGKSGGGDASKLEKKLADAEATLAELILENDKLKDQIKNG